MGDAPGGNTIVHIGFLRQARTKNFTVIQTGLNLATHGSAATGPTHFSGCLRCSHARIFHPHSRVLHSHTHRGRFAAPVTHAHGVDLPAARFTHTRRGAIPMAHAHRIHFPDAGRYRTGFAVPVTHAHTHAVFVPVAVLGRYVHLDDGDVDDNQHLQPSLLAEVTFNADKIANVKLWQDRVGQVEPEPDVVDQHQIPVDGIDGAFDAHGNFSGRGAANGINDQGGDGAIRF